MAVRYVSYGPFGADFLGSSSNIYYSSGASNYVVGIFSNSGTLNFSGFTNFAEFDFLLVGGGGGGGGNNSTQGIGGGGGGGGVVYASNITITQQSNISITIGNGGSWQTNGGNTTFLTYTALGGGGGGGYNFGATVAAKSGGCGGGSGIRAGAGGAGSQGGNGATGFENPQANGGGGGGAGGTPGVANPNGGTGQNGAIYSITGTNVYYGGGGGGGSDTTTFSGGLGGGGAGAQNNGNPTAGTDGLGGGGGGTSRGTVTGANGGKGIFIIRGRVKYLFPLMRMSNQVIVNQRTTFLGTGSVQTFTVPAGVFQIRFFLWGAGGLAQNGFSTSYGGQGGGSGGYMEGNLLTTPGTVYYIIVGRTGGVTGLANGGPGTGGGAAHAGGFSGIFSGSPAANTVIAIAGGGGGSGFNGGGSGGGGGFPSGGSPVIGGGGGTQTAGGAGYLTAQSGSQLQGGNGVAGDNGGGGGGGGWYGGGGGVANPGNTGRPGGGGSSTFSSIVINPISVNGNFGPTGANGQVTPAANEASPFWISPYGQSGQSGLVVIGYNINVYTYKYVRFTMLLSRGGWTGNGFQLSEFQLLLNGSPVSYTGASILPVVGGAEGTANLIDGNVGTKAFNFGPFFTVVAATTFSFDSYRWATANDVPDRDPVRWILDASQDNTNWVVLDDKSTVSQTITTNRFTFTETYSLPLGSSTPLSIRLSQRVPTTVQTFSYTGGDQTFIVPPGVLSIAVYMWGAGGGGGGSGGIGAAGAMIQGILRVNIAQVLTVIVGQGGAIGRSSYGGGGSGNGFGGGAAGGGGGRSALILAGTEVATAGGGGGGGNGSNARGGAATFSGTALDGSGANGGKGASQTAGGAAGGNFGSPGGARVGGKGEGLGGGGGGGYFGGGGAGNNSDASGGGGSSFTTNLSLAPGQTVFGFNSSDGQSAPNTTSPYYASGVGSGASGQGVSGNGRVVIVY
jgi:hypothetical protein